MLISYSSSAVPVFDTVRMEDPVVPPTSQVAIDEGSTPIMGTAPAVVSAK